MEVRKSKKFRIKSYISVMTIILWFLLFISAKAQIEIVADTLGTTCYQAYKTGQKIFIITSQEEYDRLANNEECSPFYSVDYENYILVGYLHNGSNCDMDIMQCKVVSNDTNHTIQFAVCANVCRDSQIQIAWFVISKPKDDLDIEFKRTFIQCSR